MSNKSINILQHSNTTCNKDDYKNGKYLKSLWLSIPAYCHLHCPYCFASTNDKGQNVSSFSREVYEKVIRDFAELGGEFIGIPGDGEPFHNKNWELTKFIISLCEELKIKLALFTTGDLIFFESNSEPSKINKIDFIKDKDIVLLIKYNHSNPKIQNKLVGNNPNYTQLREKTIDLLINTYHFNDERRRLGFVTSIMNENSSKEEENGKLEIINIFERTERDNIIFDCDTILELGRGKTFSKNDHCVPPQIDLKKVFDVLKEAGASGLEQGGTYVGNTCCDRILHHLYIKANGDVFPCIGCSRDDLSKDMRLGNITLTSLKDIWLKPLRRRLAENRYNTLVGVCANCENFQTEACYSCLGRCIATGNDAHNADGTFNTIGCIHHKPSTTIWLSDMVDYIRTVREYDPTIKSLKEDGLETLWRPNKNVAFTLWQLSGEKRKEEIDNIIKNKSNPHNNNEFKLHKDIIHSKIADFSLKKHYKFSELQFPMNKVWDFIKDPYIFFQDEKGNTVYSKDEMNILLSAVSQSLLSNIFLPSFKILFNKYDNQNVDLRYVNFIFFDNIKEKYFYRSIVKNEAETGDIGEIKSNYVKSLIISRWYENIKIDGKDTNLWGEHCYNLSATFRDELYGDYELKLAMDKEQKQDETKKIISNKDTIDVSSLLNEKYIKEKVDKFVKHINTDKKFETNFYEEISLKNINGTDEKVKLCSILNSKIFLEIEDNTILDKIKVLYESINKIAFYQTEDPDIINKFSSVLKSLYLESKNNDIISELINVFNKEKSKGRAIKVVNYFIYLGIMHKALGINYYYLLHSTNFSYVNPKNTELKADDSEFSNIIKGSGILLCTQYPINNYFRAELRLFLSNILQPFDEFYYKELYGEVDASKKFSNKIEAHRHTLVNLILPHFSRIKNSKVLNDYDKYAVLMGFLAAFDVTSQEDNSEKIKVINTIRDVNIKSIKDILNFVLKYFLATESVYFNTYSFINNISSFVSSNEINDYSKLDLITILYNIILNAFKATTPLDKMKEISIFIYENDSHKVSISVENIFDNRNLISNIVINEACSFLKMKQDQYRNYFSNKNNHLLKPTGGISIIKKLTLENEWEIIANANFHFKENLGKFKIVLTL